MINKDCELIFYFLNNQIMVFYMWSDWQMPAINIILKYCRCASVIL